MSPTTSGCVALIPFITGHGYSHSSFDPSALRPTSRDAREDDDLSARRARSRASASEYACVSLIADHSRLPVARSYAATDWPSGPPGRTTIASPTTSGAAAMPQCRLPRRCPSRMFVRQSTRPAASSRARSSPVAPSAKTRPSNQVGVARGPSPPIDSRNSAGHALVHNSRPVRDVVGGDHFVRAALLDGEGASVARSTNDA